MPPPFRGDYALLDYIRQRWHSWIRQAGAALFCVVSTQALALEDQPGGRQITNLWGVLGKSTGQQFGRDGLIIWANHSFHKWKSAEPTINIASQQQPKSSLPVPTTSIGVVHATINRNWAIAIGVPVLGPDDICGIRWGRLRVSGKDSNTAFVASPSQTADSFSSRCDFLPIRFPRAGKVHDTQIYGWRSAMVFEFIVQGDLDRFLISPFAEDDSISQRDGNSDPRPLGNGQGLLSGISLSLGFAESVVSDTSGEKSGAERKNAKGERPSAVRILATPVSALCGFVFAIFGVPTFIYGLKTDRFIFQIVGGLSIIVATPLCGLWLLIG